MTGLPIVGWWPEVNIAAPTVQAGIFMTAPTIEIMPSSTAEFEWLEFIVGMMLTAPTISMTTTPILEFGWPDLFIGMLLTAATVEMMPSPMVTIG